MSGEELLAAARRVVWQGWMTSSEEIGSQAVLSLDDAGMLVAPGGSAELEKLRGENARLKAELEAAQAPADTYPPAMPWAALMDHEDLTDFRDELGAAAIANASCEDALAKVEETCGRWRAIAEAQHAHNTAPGPDAITRLTVPVQVLREGEHYAATHHDYRVPRDLPDTTTPMGDPR